MQHPPPAPSGSKSSSTTNPSKPPRRRNRNNYRQRRKKQQSGGPPPTPYLKLTVRDIGQADKYGTCQELTVLIRALVEHANEKIPMDQRMELDEAALEHLIRDDEAYLAAKNEWEEQQNKENEVQDEEDKEDGGESKNEEMAPVETEEAAADARKEVTKMEETPKEDTQIVSEMQKKLHLSSGISTSVLYMVPPKKTRRKGEKPGVAYLVLTAPPITVRPEPMPPVTDGTTTPSPAPQTVDYSRDVAQRRLMLVRALQALKQVAALDRTSKQEWAGCVVEESLNDKIWRPVLKPDRLEGTVTETADYQNFEKRKLERQEERSARPKPAPGGMRGLAAGTTTTGTDGQPVATLVLHLQVKHEDQAKRRKAKAKRVASKKAARGKDAPQQQGGSGGNKPAEGKKKSKKARNKKQKAGPKPVPSG